MSNEKHFQPFVEKLKIHDYVQNWKCNVKPIILLITLVEVIILNTTYFINNTAIYGIINVDE